MSRAMSRRGGTDGKVHHEVLANGLTLLLRESHTAPVADLQIWANVGSADERRHEAGLAHFHEHMLFKGTERRGVGEVAGEIEGAGGRINAYTSFDVTVYYATVPSDAIEAGFDVLVDAIRHSTFDPAEIDREIEVVLEEIRRSEDSPGHVLSDAVFREHYHKHRYGLPILGPAESVASFDRKKVTNFWKRWYTPDNLVVVAAGDFDTKQLAKHVKRLYRGAQGGDAVREPRQKEMRSVVVKRPFERMKLDLTWPSAAFRDADATYLDLLAFLFGEAESSRLVRRVREEEELADRIDCSSYTPFDPGVFSINVDVEDVKAFDAIRACSREVERLRSEPVGRDELERARANFLASEHFERETVSGLASKLGNFHLLGGDWRSEERYFDTLAKTTVEDLHRVAKKHLAPEALTLGVLLPDASSVKATRRNLERAVRQGIEDAHAKAAVPKRLRAKARAKTAGTGKGRPAKRGVHVESYRLDGGTELHVAARDNAPVVAVRAAFLGGLLAQTPETAGLCHFLSSTWTRGTERLSAGALARAVEDLASEIDGFSGRSSLGLTLDVATEQLDPALDLFAEVLLSPGFAADEIEKQRRETLATIDRLEDQLAQQAFALFARTHFEEHPYRLPMVGTRESVAAFDEDVLRHHQGRLIGSRNLAIGVAGDVDPDAIAAGLSARLTALPEGEPLRDHIPAIEAAPDSIRTGRLQKDRAQAHLVMGFRGLSVDDPDRQALDVISQLLAGQSGRLFLELRDKQSLAYSVNAMSVEGYAPGYFVVYIATAPEKLEEARSGMLRELTRLVDEPPGAREFEEARRNLIGNHAIGQQRNAGHAAHLALDALYGMGAGAHLHYGERVAAVTREDVVRVARRIVRLDAYTESVVAP